MIPHTAICVRPGSRSHVSSVSVTSGQIKCLLQRFEHKYGHGVGMNSLRENRVHFETAKPFKSHCDALPIATKHC